MEVFTIVLDRIEDGIAVFEYTDGSTIECEASRVPNAFQEGDIIEATCRAGELEFFCKDIEAMRETHQRNTERKIRLRDRIRNQYA